MQSDPQMSPTCCSTAIIWHGGLKAVNCCGLEQGKRENKKDGWHLASHRWGKVPLAAAPPVPPEAGGSPKSTSRLQTSWAPSLNSRAETTPATISQPFSQTTNFPSVFPWLHLNSLTLAPLLCFLASNWGKPRCNTCSLMKISHKAVSYPNKASQLKLPCSFPPAACCAIKLGRANPQTHVEFDRERSLGAEQLKEAIPF